MSLPENQRVQESEQKTPQRARVGFWTITPGAIFRCCGYVVLAVVGFVLLMSVPECGQREASRAVHCKSNLEQLAVQCMCILWTMRVPSQQPAGSETRAGRLRYLLRASMDFDLDWRCPADRRNTSKRQFKSLWTTEGSSYWYDSDVPLDAPEDFLIAYDKQPFHRTGGTWVHRRSGRNALNKAGYATWIEESEFQRRLKGTGSMEVGEVTCTGKSDSFG